MKCEVNRHTTILSIWCSANSRGFCLTSEGVLAGRRVLVVVGLGVVGGLDERRADVRPVGERRVGVAEDGGGAQPPGPADDDVEPRGAVRLPGDGEGARRWGPLA